MDAHANFAYGTVLTAPSPATSGTSLVLNSGQGAAMPTPPFNVVIWPANVIPTVANAEIARCTNVATDTCTLIRAQEGTSARTVVVGDQVAVAVTAKTLTDIETQTLDQIAGAAANVDLHSHKLINVTDPTSAQHAATKNYVDTQVALPAPAFAADGDINTIFAISGAAMTAALTPVFQPIKSRGIRTYSLTQLAARLATISAANTLGMAVYSIVYTDATHWSATLVAQLNAAASTATPLRLLKSDVTGGAAGSGAGAVTLDFINNYYVVGSMASDLTAQFTGYTLNVAAAGLGYLSWSAAARSSTTDWPSSFDQTQAGILGTVRCNSHFLFNATGKILV